MGSPKVKTPPGRAANALVHSAFILAGAATIILGPVLPILISRWSLTDEQAGLLFTFQFCGNLLGIAALGPLVSRQGYGRTFGIGFSLIALGLAALNSGHELISVTSTAVFGCGLGLVLPGANLWVAEVAQTRRASALSILNFAWGIGAITCPVLIMFAQRNNRLSILFFGIASVAALFALGFMTIDIEPLSGFNPDVAPPRDVAPVKLRTAVTLACLFFLYCGTESAVGGWTAVVGSRISTYLLPLFSDAQHQLGGVLSGSTSSKKMFVDTSGAQTPTWERVAMVGSMLIWVAVIICRVFFPRRLARLSPLLLQFFPAGSSLPRSPSSPGSCSLRRVRRNLPR